MLALLGACSAAPAPHNMNGQYVYTPTPNAPAGVPFSTNYADYPGGAEYFDVYHGPITSRYAEVFWTGVNNAIPDEIRTRFDGKVMAIIGIETDQVRKTA